MCNRASTLNCLANNRHTRFQLIHRLILIIIIILCGIMSENFRLFGWWIDWPISTILYSCICAQENVVIIARFYVPILHSGYWMFSHYHIFIYILCDRRWVPEVECITAAQTTWVTISGYYSNISLVLFSGRHSSFRVVI